MVGGPCKLALAVVLHRSAAVLNVAFAPDSRTTDSVVMAETPVGIAESLRLRVEVELESQWAAPLETAADTVELALERHSFVDNPVFVEVR